MTDVNSILDAKLDDLADLPSFKPFAAGAHQVLATMEVKDINGKQTVELAFTMIETAELADANDEAPVAGDTANTMFFLDNEIGQGKFKEAAAVFAASLGLADASNREIVEAVTDIECMLLSGTRKDKNDPSKTYLDVKEIQVL